MLGFSITTTFPMGKTYGAPRRSCQLRQKRRKWRGMVSLAPAPAPPFLLQHAHVPAGGGGTSAETFLAGKGLETQKQAGYSTCADHANGVVAAPR